MWGNDKDDEESADDEWGNTSWHFSLGITLYLLSGSSAWRWVAMAMFDSRLSQATTAVLYTMTEIDSCCEISKATCLVSSLSKDVVM